jgi:hypothetical protein
MQVWVEVEKKTRFPNLVLEVSCVYTSSGQGLRVLSRKRLRGNVMPIEHCYSLRVSRYATVVYILFVTLIYLRYLDQSIRL